MRNRPHSFTGSKTGELTSKFNPPTSRLQNLADGWLLACDINQHSEKTIYTRRQLIRHLIWFLNKRGSEECGVGELRAFLAYCTNGHREPGGRWGNPRCVKPTKPRTIHTYHGHLRTFFSWLVAEGELEASPMERIPPPIFRSDQIEPFSREQIEAMLRACRNGRHAQRDEALILFLLDTGVRASELCSINFEDIDLLAYRVTVLGKGNKRRVLYFSKPTAKALWGYLRGNERDEDDGPLFVSERGDRLTRSGVQQLIERLGKIAKIRQTRCSPHTFRHTFAVEFLRAGGNTFSLQTMLGHTNLAMTMRYVHLAQADIEGQHRQFSPVERLRRR